MSKIRNSLRKYAKAIKDDIEDQISQKIQQESGFLYREFNMRMPGLSIINILKLVFVLVLISPWIYLCVKNGIFSSFFTKVMSFYDDKFIISNPVANSTLANDQLQKTGF